MADQRSGVDLAAIGALAAGSLLLYAGIKGFSIPRTLQLVVQGESPAGQAQASAITGGATLTSSTTASSTGSSPGPAAAGGNATGGTDAQNEALGKQMAAAAPYNWTGAEWTALNNIVMAESGWNDTILNTAGSGAAGIAQNINGFGAGYESGNAAQQIAWLLAYIKSRYGTPIVAWAFHLANGWY